MKNFSINFASPQTPNKIRTFLEKISLEDGINYDFYLGEDANPADIFCIAMDDYKIIGYSYAIVFEDCAEITGIVAGDYRRQHIFADMLKMLNINKPYCFTGREIYPGFLKVCNVLGFNKIERDYLMSATALSHSQNTLNYEWENNFYYFYDTTDEPVGYCGIDDFCIHDVYVYPKFRRQGYGLRIMNTVFAIFPAATFLLHVEEKNTAAVKLYRRCGFDIVDTICRITR